MSSWIHCIKDAMSLANEREERVRSAIRENKIDKNLSDLVIYCQTVPFDLESKYTKTSFIFILSATKNSLSRAGYSNSHLRSHSAIESTEIDSKA